MSVQAVLDSKGKQTAVLISIKDWESIQKKLNTFELYKNFSSSLKELSDDLNGKTNLTDARDFLDEIKG